MAGEDRHGFELARGDRARLRRENFVVHCDAKGGDIPHERIPIEALKQK